MSENDWRILNATRWPARLSVEEVSILLGLKPHDVTHLVAAGFLKPLRKPTPNAPKKFAAVYIEKLRADEQWLHKATLLISKIWFEKNMRAKRGKRSDRMINGGFANSRSA